MKVGELKSVLKRLEDLYRAGGASSAAKDLCAVAELLEGHETESLDQFIAETKALIDETIASVDKPKSGAARLNSALAKTHAQALLDAGTDEDPFNAALDLLDKDVSITAAEWVEIANIYRNAPTGGTHRYKFASIKAARNAILDTFGGRLESTSKRGIIERITQWAS